MLDRDPTTRATIDELICMDWVTNCGQESISADLIAHENNLQGVRQVSRLKSMPKILIPENKQNDLVNSY